MAKVMNPQGMCQYKFPKVSSASSKQMWKIGPKKVSTSINNNYSSKLVEHLANGPNDNHLDNWNDYASYPISTLLFIGAFVFLRCWLVLFEISSLKGGTSGGWQVVFIYT